MTIHYSLCLPKKVLKYTIKKKTIKEESYTDDYFQEFSFDPEKKEVSIYDDGYNKNCINSYRFVTVT